MLLSSGWLEWLSNLGRVYGYRRETVAPLGTAQLLLSGTHKKRIYPELLPMSPEPRLAPMTSLLQPGKVKPCPEVQAAQVSLPAMHGVGDTGALSHSRDVGWREIPLGERRDGAGLFPQLTQERGIKVPHAVKIESFFLLPLLRRNKMCKHISPLAYSLSLGRMVGFPKKPLLHQQTEEGRQSDSK